MSTIPASNTTFRAARQGLGLPEQAAPSHASPQPTAQEVSPDQPVIAVLDVFTSTEPKGGASTKDAFDRVTLTGDVSEREARIVADHGTHVVMTIETPSPERIESLKGETLAVTDQKSETTVSVSKKGDRIEIVDSDGASDAKAFIQVSGDKQGTLNFLNGSTRVSVELGDFDPKSPLAGANGLMHSLPEGPLGFMAVSDHSIEARVHHTTYWIHREQGGDWQLSGFVGY